MKAHTTAASSYLSELMTAQLLSTARDHLIKRYQKKTKNNYRIVKKWMNHHTELLQWVEPDGGIFCFPKYRIHMSSLELCKQVLTTHKLLVNPGTYFNQEGHIRLSYGIDEQELQTGLTVLADALQKLLKDT